MKILDILNEYRSGDLEFKMKYELLDTETLHKIDVLNQIFCDADLMDFVIDHVRVVRLYYKEKKTIEQISEIMFISSRHVYRMRNKCVEWLSDLLDKDPSPMSEERP